jgi:dienelactone hydrolase
LAEGVRAQVFMPDFFGEGNAFPIEKFPIKDEQSKKELQDFFAGIANPPATATRLVEFANVLKSRGFKKTGAIGYCWGNTQATISRFTLGSLSFLRLFQEEKLSP